MDFLPTRFRAPCENRIALALARRRSPRATCDSSRALGRQLAARDGTEHGAAGLALVLAVAETAALRERGDVREARLDAADVVEQPELAQPGVSMSTPPPGSSMSCRAVVVCRPRSSLRNPPTACASRPSSAIRQRRLADARRADEPDGLARADVARAARRRLRPTLRSRARRARRSRRDSIASSSGARSASRSTLLSTIDGLGAAAPDGRHETLEPALVEVAVDGRHDEEHVDVDGDDLRLVERAGGAPQQRRAPLEHVLNRRAVRAVDDGDPIADDGPLELVERRRATCRSESPSGARHPPRENCSALPPRCARAPSPDARAARAAS